MKIEEEMEKLQQEDFRQMMQSLLFLKKNELLNNNYFKILLSMFKFNLIK